MREQRCWVHKTANVLNKLPKFVQPKVKKRLQDIWMAETKDEAEKAFDFFVETFAHKYDKAVACLAKDREAMLTFYDFPAEHWKHLRTTNLIESTFATVCLRTARTKGGLRRKTVRTMVFKLCQTASKMAPSGWFTPTRRDHPGRHVQGWRKANRPRRLKPSSPTFGIGSRESKTGLPLFDNWSP